MRWLLGFIPFKLPIGREAFDAWAKDVIALAGVPDNASTRFALGVMIMHRPPTESAKPKRFFAKQLYKAAVNEVAHALISEIKENQRAEDKAKGCPLSEAENSQSAEATALPRVVNATTQQPASLAGEVVRET